MPPPEAAGGSLEDKFRAATFGADDEERDVKAIIGDCSMSLFWVTLELRSRRVEKIAWRSSKA